jgi:hypothetical protein
METIMKHMRRLRLEFREQWNFYLFECQMEDVPIDWFYFLRNFIRFNYIAPVICFFTDHIIEVDCCIGPDSGTEDLVCIRCGWSKHIIYY